MFRKCDKRLCQCSAYRLNKDPKMGLWTTQTIFFTTFAFPVLAIPCDSFRYGDLCKIDPANVIWTIPNLVDELRCQDECVQTIQLDDL